jgi:hypothetical protein
MVVMEQHILDHIDLEHVNGGLGYGASCFVGGTFGALFGSALASGPGAVAGAAIGCVTGVVKRAIDGPSS